MTKHGDLFTDRQLVALTTFSDLVQEARLRVEQDALAAGLDAPAPPPTPMPWLRTWRSRWIDWWTAKLRYVLGMSDM